MKGCGIAVVGSLNMDVVVSMPRLPRIGETMLGQSVRYVPGGKGANQAYGLARLKAPVAMVGLIGADGFGERIRRQMAEAGVDLASVETSESLATGTAHISLTPEDNCIVVVPGANDACDEAYIERHAQAIRGAAVTIAQLEVPLAAVERAFRIAKEAGGITVLNPAPAADLPASLLAMTDYMTPNETEWAVLSGGSDSGSGSDTARAAAGDDEDTGEEEDSRLAASLRAWETAQGAKVIVTRGARGCSFLEEGKLVTVPAPKVQAVDTTGAGDAFNAAFAYGLLQGKPLLANCTFAVKAASMAVQVFGAQDGMPHLEDLMRP
jgi:ribokinase